MMICTMKKASSLKVGDYLIDTKSNKSEIVEEVVLQRIDELGEASPVIMKVTTEECEHYIRGEENVFVTISDEDYKKMIKSVADDIWKSIMVEIEK